MEVCVISDLHLGNPNCQAEQLLRFLQGVNKAGKVDLLILNGDIIENMDFRRWTEEHWNILRQLRCMRCRVVWLEGNHDTWNFGYLMDIATWIEYAFYDNGKQFLFLHGDKFDHFINEHPIWTWIGDLIYQFFQRIDPSHTWARWIKTTSKSWRHVEQEIRRKAIEYSKSLNCDMVCCGHTHHAVLEGNYANSGSWAEKPCSYLWISDGEVSLHTFE